MSLPEDDLDRFRWPATLSDGTPALRKTVPSPRNWFLKGPIPGEWLEIASRLPGRALHVGLAIWFQSGLTKSREVRITNRTRRLFATLPDAYRRGLKQLESVGLVHVVRAPGRCAVVTILDPPSSGGPKIAAITPKKLTKRRHPL